MLQVWVLFFVSLLFPRGALANVVGGDFQTFNPTTNGLGFVTVQSSETLDPCVYNFGFFLNYAINALPQFENDKPILDRNGKWINTATFADINLGVGLTEHWDFGLSFPAILAQEIKESTSRIQYKTQGINEVRLNTKYQFLGRNEFGVALVGTFNKNLIQDNPYVGRGPGLSYTAEVVGHITLKRLMIAGNVGYRWKNPPGPVSGFPVEPFQDQAIASAGVSYYFESLDTNVIAEIYGGTPTESNSEFQQLQRTAEMLVGAKIDLTKEYAMHFGATTGLKQAPVSPDGRIYAGINAACGPFCDKTPIPRKSKRRKKRRQKRKPKPVIAEAVVAPEPAPPIEPIDVGPIYFNFDSERKTITGTQKEIERLVEHLGVVKWKVLNIEGHTDSVGTDFYNIQLSQERAQTVVKYLAKKYGLPLYKLRAIGKGEREPIDTNATYQGRLRNRRVEFDVVYE